MSKGNGLWKLVLAGFVVSSTVAGGMYLSVPKSPNLSVDTVKAAEGDYARSLYGMPELGMGHYKLDDDQYFKYQVDGTLDISRDNPSKLTSWLVENEVWSTSEFFDKDRVKFDEKRLAILNALGDTENASKIESGLKEKEESEALEDAKLDEELDDGDTSEDDDVAGDGEVTEDESVVEVVEPDGATSDDVGSDVEKDGTE